MIYNVKIPVIDLVEADSPGDAIDKMRRILSDAGFEVYPDGMSAFESESLPEGTEVHS